MIERRPSMNEARMNFGTLVHEGYLYCVGGAGPKRTLLNTCERINIHTYKQWEKLPNLNETRFSSSLILLENWYLYCIASSIVNEISNEDEEMRSEFENWSEEKEQ